MLKQVTKVGYKLFGKYVHNYRRHLQPIADRLRVARIPYTVEDYVAGAAIFALLLFAVSFVFFVGFFHFIQGRTLLASIPISLLTAVSISGLSVIIFLGYPSYVARRRGEDIHTRLALAVTHMATLAGTGIPPANIFKTITKFKDYGEISRECAFIVRDMDVFGKDLFTVIMDAARHSPSKLWSEVLWGIESTLRSGGNLRAYLSEKARQLVELHEREERKAIETLNVLTEVFMVIFVLAPVIGVIIVVFMSMLGGTVFGTDPKLILMMIIYFILPVVGFGFVIVGEMSKPKEVL